MNIIQRFKKGLEKSRESINESVDRLLMLGRKVDEELLEELEEILIASDVGIKTTMEIVDELRNRIKTDNLKDGEQVKQALKDTLVSIMGDDENGIRSGASPVPLLFVGVNGAGKTTTIGKLAYMFRKQGKKVLLAAGDTFRAAAVDQLEEWSNRVSAELIKNTQGTDPAAVIFDALQAAKARKADILLCDTAGRLHNKKNLMEELKKIQRVINRETGENSGEIFLVVDATTGQNALAQARLFKDAVDVTGIILTKLDGTAKGGIVFAIKNELDIPVKFVGMGEGVEDLQPFDSRSFVEAIFN